MKLKSSLPTLGNALRRRNTDGGGQRSTQNATGLRNSIVNAGRNVLNRFHRRRAKEHAVHLHSHWLQPRERPSVPNSDSRFRGALAEAYLVAARSAQEAPANVDSHFWTDRQNAMALLTPVVFPNLTELEIPHSMLALSPLKVHFEPELDEAVSRVGPQLRSVLRECLHHPATANMGAGTWRRGQDGGRHVDRRDVVDARDGDNGRRAEEGDRASQGNHAGAFAECCADEAASAS